MVSEIVDDWVYLQFELSIGCCEVVGTDYEDVAGEFHSPYLLKRHFGSVTFLVAMLLAVWSLWLISGDDLAQREVSLSSDARHLPAK